MKSPLLPKTPHIDNLDSPAATHFLPTTTELSPVQTTGVIAQFDQDILGDLGNAFGGFIESGQIWALLIGIVIGYIIRGITTYK
ncbi:MAG: hypothetical protein AAGH78_18645 [Cyanobacteria bacterium P01_H01_bin.58]